MEVEQFRQQELTRFIKWVSENREIWRKICTNETKSAIEYEKYLEMLIEQKFYNAILTLVMANVETINVTEFLVNLGMVKLSESWDENMSRKFISFLNEKIEKRKQWDIEWNEKYK